MPLASSQQRMPPSATHLTAESIQAHQIGGDSVVIKVALHRAVQARADDSDGLTPSLHQRRSDCGQDWRAVFEFGHNRRESRHNLISDFAAWLGKKTGE